MQLGCLFYLKTIHSSRYAGGSRSQQAFRQSGLQVALQRRGSVESVDHHPRLKRRRPTGSHYLQHHRSAAQGAQRFVQEPNHSLDFSVLLGTLSFLHFIGDRSHLRRNLVQYFS